MKKVIITIMILALLVSIVFMGLSCKKVTTASDSSETAEASSSKGLLYYMQFDLINGFNIGSGQYMEKFGKEAGFDIKLLNAQGKSDTQVNQMDTAISQKPKAIIIKPVDAATITASVDKARAAGIPVISYDGTITDTKVDFHSVVGTVKMGKMAAEECVKILKEKNGSEKGKVLQIMGDLGDMYSVLIDQGFKEEIGKYPNINVITKDTPGWEQTVTANVASDQLTANKDIDIIFIHADSRVPGIVPVLEEKGYKQDDIKIIGTDGDPSALQMIKDGWIYETIGVPMVQQVYGVFQFIDKVIAKEELKPGNYDVKGVQAELKVEEWGPTLYLPGEIITKQNVDDPGLWGNIKQ